MNDILLHSDDEMCRRLCLTVNDKPIERLETVEKQKMPLFGRRAVSHPNAAKTWNTIHY